MWQSYGSVEAAPHQPVSVAAIVNEVVKGAGNIASQNSVELVPEICQESCTLLGDALQIKRAIQNVIINAIQAAAETKGTVKVNCLRKDFYVDVRVEDTGIGMLPTRDSKNLRAVLHHEAGEEWNRPRALHHQKGGRRSQRLDQSRQHPRGRNDDHDPSAVAQQLGRRQQSAARIG